MTETARAALQQSDLFHFVDGVVDGKLVAGLVDLDQADRYGGASYLLDHIAIGAAEFSLVESGSRVDWDGYPVVVSSTQLVMASLKYDCSMGNICVPSALIEGWVLDRMSVFSADIARVWRVLDRHGGFAKLSSGPSELHRVIAEVEELYVRHPSEAVRNFAERKCVRVQGLLWRMQLTTAHSPGFEGDPYQAMRDSGEVLGLF